MLECIKVFTVLLQALILPIPNLTASNATETELEFVDQYLIEDDNHTTQLSVQPNWYELTINFNDFPQNQLKKIDSAIKSLERIFRESDQTNFNCSHQTQNGDSNQSEAKEIDQQEFDVESSEWYEENHTIWSNITDLCKKGGHQRTDPYGNSYFDSVPLIEASSTGSLPFTRTTTTTTTTRYDYDQYGRYRPRTTVNLVKEEEKLQWLFSPADSLPWLRIDLKNVRRIYYFLIGIQDYHSSSVNIKMFYGNEKKEGWNITKEKFFDSYEGPAGEFIFKSNSSHYAEGRYFYIIKFQHKTQLEIKGLECYGG